MSYVSSLKIALDRSRQHPVCDYAFKSAFQPIFSPTLQRLVGYEALMRASLDGESVSPAEVFKQAHQLQLTERLDSQLQAMHLQTFAQHDPNTWLFLNISPTTCVQPDKALNHLQTVCNEYNVAPSKVVLEVVETATENKTQLLEFVRKARNRGFQIAIDDFGVGDSNFERVWQLEPLIIKIDRSLLVNAENHTRARQLLNGLVGMIRESGSLVLIEGIETPEQARIALATEADLLQGFLFGYPQPLGQPRSAPELDFTQHLDNYQRHSQQDGFHQDGFLRLLRFEVLEACHRLAAASTLSEACNGLLQLAGVKRCFVLDSQGIQQGGLASETRVQRDTQFNPLYQSSGACWAHRDYFRRAQERPHKINACRPYVALPDAVRTVTLSVCLEVDGEAKVFCVDLHPDELFDGHLVFPDIL